MSRPSSVYPPAITPSCKDLDFFHVELPRILHLCDAPLHRILTTLPMFHRILTYLGGREREAFADRSPRIVWENSATGHWASQVSVWVNQRLNTKYVKESWAHRGKAERREERRRTGIEDQRQHLPIGFSLIGPGGGGASGLVCGARSR